MMDVVPPDSAALRSHGATLRAIADGAHVTAERLDRLVDAAEFRGPAADRFRAGMADRLVRLRVVARDLDDLAGVVAQSGDVSAT